MILRAPFGPKNMVCLNLTKVFSIKNNVQYQKQCSVSKTLHKISSEISVLKKCSVSKTPHKISSRNKNNFGHAPKRSNHPLNPGAQKHCFKWFVRGVSCVFHFFAAEQRSQCPPRCIVFAVVLGFLWLQQFLDLYTF